MLLRTILGNFWCSVVTLLTFNSNLIHNNNIKKNIYIYIISDFFGFFPKLLRFLLNVTKVTTEHQKLPKIGQNSIKSIILPKGQKIPRLKAEALRRS